MLTKYYRMGKFTIWAANTSAVHMTRIIVNKFHAIKCSSGTYPLLREASTVHEKVCDVLGSLQSIQYSMLQTYI